METLTILQAAFLGLIQGLAEFLPVSSSGHLAIIQHFFEVKGDDVLIFTVLLHVGTLISVFIIYWKDIWELIIELGYTIKDIFTGKGLRIDSSDTRKFGFLIIVATIPTAIIGLLFNDLFTSFYGNLVAIGIGLVFTGTILFIANRLGQGKVQIKNMNFRNAIFVGIMQGIAITPGVSRSGSTLFGSLVCNINRELAVKYAFLISIPSILGSAILEAPKAFLQGLDMTIMLPILVGVVVATVSGIVAIKTMIKVVTKNRLSYFSYYTWILGVLTIGYGLFIA
ncbi:MAG: undecaprenyl-diphosphate phosphatase [Anaerovoracaceae bacterium]